MSQRWGGKRVRREEQENSMSRPKLRRRVRMPSRKQVQDERRKIQYRKAYRKALSSTIYVLVVVAAIAVLIATLVLPVLQISGTSMEPTLNDGEIVVLVKTERFEPGDLCSFTWNNRTLIKRVIGGPGDWIEIDDDGTIYLNGEALEEPYVTDKSLGECDLEFPYQVPENSYFLVGDHRETSIDSRSSVIGSVTKEQIIGRVIFRVWPLDKMTII